MLKGCQSGSCGYKSIGNTFSSRTGMPEHRAFNLAKYLGPNLLCFPSPPSIGQVHLECRQHLPRRLCCCSIDQCAHNAAASAVWCPRCRVLGSGQSTSLALRSSRREGWTQPGPSSRADACERPTPAHSAYITARVGSHALGPPAYSSATWPSLPGSRSPSSMRFVYVAQRC